LEPILDSEKPDIVLVQGDTTTTLCGALSAFYKQIPVGHVEAGLRTGDFQQPFPEEMNRVLTTRLTTLHFAPTNIAAANLCREGVNRQSIFVTGNTGIDAILSIRDALEQGRLRGLNGGLALDATKRLIVVTAHRRESFGKGFESICFALHRLAQRTDVQIVYPVHPNPNVRNSVRRHLENCPNILLTEPMEYVPFVDLMRHAYVILTDSGGIQEEAPSLGKPVLVLRDKTERMEAVQAGTATLVGTGERSICEHTEVLLDDEIEYEKMASSRNPFGDGYASRRIGAILESFFLFQSGSL
jgi:UDP-N-acetylglucosamine 2-epimerase (non-hydrolysing)